MALLGALFVLNGCAATPQEVTERLGDRYVGKNVDALVGEFGPPASLFKMNSGETAYVWQLSSVTDIQTDRGSGTARTQFCKVNVIASPSGVVNKLTTEDSARGMLGMYGSVCSQRLGMQRQT
jgi:hypothetical protein